MRWCACAQVLLCLNADVLVGRYAIALMCLYTDVLLCLYAHVLVCLYTDVLVCLYAVGASLLVGALLFSVCPIGWDPSVPRTFK